MKQMRTYFKDLFITFLDVIHRARVRTGAGRQDLSPAIDIRWQQASAAAPPARLALAIFWK